MSISRSEILRRKKETEVEKLMGDHGRSMGGHVRSVGVMGGQWGVLRGQWGVMGGQWVVLGGQWEVKGGSRQVTRRLLKVSGTPLQNAHCQRYGRAILKSDEIQWQISEIKQEHKVSYRCSLPSPLQKRSEDYKGLGGSASFELLSFLWLWQEVSQISEKHPAKVLENSKA